MPAVGRRSRARIFPNACLPACARVRQVNKEEGEELPGVSNLELSMDEMDEQRCGGCCQGIKEARMAGLGSKWGRLLGSRAGVAKGSNAHSSSLADPRPLNTASHCKRSKKGERAADAAKQAALKLLSGRSHSRRELKTKLLERGHELGDVRAALDRLQEVGLQVGGRVGGQPGCLALYGGVVWTPIPYPRARRVPPASHTRRAIKSLPRRLRAPSGGSPSGARAASSWCAGLAAWPMLACWAYTARPAPVRTGCPCATAALTLTACLPACLLPSSSLPQELHHRGIPPELATAALAEVFGAGGLDLAQHLEQLEDGEAPPLAIAGALACRPAVGWAGAGVGFGAGRACAAG